MVARSPRYTGNSVAQNQRNPRGRPGSTLLAFEELDLAESLDGLRAGLVAAPEVLALFRDDFVSTLVFLDH
jgi:hypothetical protein